MCRVHHIVILFTAIITNVLTREDTRAKRQAGDDRWGWGYFEETVTVKPNQEIVSPRAELKNATTQSTDNEYEAEPSFCQPYNPDKPDFNTGRRISEAKCSEYIWNLEVRLEEKRRYFTCLDWRKKKYNVQFAIGGYPTGPGDYPHMGAIGWKASVGTWVFKCGSTLISEKFVLTAAHCAKAPSRDSTIADPVPKIVRLGDKNIIDHFYNGIPPTDRNISKIIVHPEFSPPRKYFDIALMELEKEVKFSRLLQPACLWTNPDMSSLGKEAVLTGWGVVETGSLNISPELQAAKVDILDTQVCDSLLKSSCHRNWCGFQEDQICAGKLAGGVDACQGDSGGPLQVKIPLSSSKEGQIHFVIGIISFGIGCAHPNLPGIYTKVSNFIDWIEGIVY